MRLKNDNDMSLFPAVLIYIAKKTQKQVQEFDMLAHEWDMLLFTEEILRQHGFPRYGNISQHNWVDTFIAVNLDLWHHSFELRNGKRCDYSNARILISIPCVHAKQPVSKLLAVLES